MTCKPGYLVLIFIYDDKIIDIIKDITLDKLFGAIIGAFIDITYIHMYEYVQCRYLYLYVVIRNELCIFIRSEFIDIIIEHKQEGEA